MTEGYHTSLSLKVDWADLDLFGHVNNVAFFRYIQAARVNYCDRIGLGSLNNTELGFIVASASCDFRSSLSYPEDIVVYSRVTRLGETSITLSHLITNSKGGVVAEGRDVLVVFDYRKKVKAMLDEDLKKIIAGVEKG